MTVDVAANGAVVTVTRNGQAVGMVTLDSDRYGGRLPGSWELRGDLSL